MSHNIPAACAIQVKIETGLDIGKDPPCSAPNEIEDVMTKLQEMSINEKEEVIDALVT
jgi:hypothetical protein